MSDERKFYHLQEQDDAAADWQPEGGDWDAYAPSYDEWDAMRLSAGQPAGTFTEYLEDINQQENHHVCTSSKDRS